MTSEGPALLISSIFLTFRRDVGSQPAPRGADQITKIPKVRAKMIIAQIQIDAKCQHANSGT